MANIAPYAYSHGTICKVSDAHLAITSSAVLYGLSIYTVISATVLSDGSIACFRMKEHFHRLSQSAKMLGMHGFDDHYTPEDLASAVTAVVRRNAFTHNHFIRVAIHATSNVAGVRTAGLDLDLSIFAYRAEPILPPSGAHLITSTWRRVSDNALPARAKVNGAYVNSSLAKQEAIDSGCDDALFLNQHGFVSELTAANIFLIKDGELITPDASSDILEGITRRTIIDYAHSIDMTVHERKVALTEVYTADEVFACGTSAFITPILSVDGRSIGTFPSTQHSTTLRLRSFLESLQSDISSPHVTRISLS